MMKHTMVSLSLFILCNTAFRVFKATFVCFSSSFVEQLVFTHPHFPPFRPPHAQGSEALFAEAFSQFGMGSR